MGPIVVVAAAAIRPSVIPLFFVAIGAIRLSMGFIQLQAGHGVPEILRVPAAVADGAIRPELGDSLAGGMATPAFDRGMIPVERPAGRGMLKSGSFLGIVTTIATVPRVTTRTDGMNFFLRLGRPNRLLNIMAAIAAFLRVAVDATEVE